MAITTTEELREAYPDLIARIEAEAKGETIISAVTVEKDKKGRIKTWTEESRDLDGVLLGKRIDEYSYYPTGEIDIIIQKRQEKGKLVDKKKVKHYKDSRQPTVEKMAIDGKIPKK